MIATYEDLRSSALGEQDESWVRTGFSEMRGAITDLAEQVGHMAAAVAVLNERLGSVMSDVTGLKLTARDLERRSTADEARTVDRESRARSTRWLVGTILAAIATAAAAAKAFFR